MKDILNRWPVKILLVIVFSILVTWVLINIGALLLSNQDSAMQAIADLKHSSDRLFWGFLVLRLTGYAGLLWMLPNLVRRQLASSEEQEIDQAIRRIRPVLLRVIIVFELLFPLDLIGHLSRWGA